MTQRRRIKGFKHYAESNLWRHKYEPQTLDDYLCTNSFRKLIDSWIDGTVDSHLLFESSSPGTGKSSLAKIIAYSTSSTVKIINGGKDRGIDVVRDEIYNFISSRSADGRRKVVIINEFEKMHPDALKAALSPIDDWTKYARFIVTCNNFSSIPNADIRDAFKDRFDHIDFMKVHGTDKDEKKALIIKTMKFCEHLLKINEVEYEKKALIQVIKDNFAGPTVRFRSIVNTLYKNSVRGLTLENLYAPDLELQEILTCANKMDFRTVRKFVAEHSGNARGIVKELYDNMHNYFKLDSDNFGDVFIVLNDCRSDLNDPEDTEIPLSNMFFVLSSMGVIDG